MNDSDYNALLSLSDRIPDQILKRYVARHGKELVENTFLPLPKIDLQNRDLLFRLLSSPSRSSGSPFCRFLYFLSHSCNVPVTHLPHERFVVMNDNDPVSVREIFDVFWSSEGQREAVIRHVESRQGGRFSKTMNEIKNERVLGAGALGVVFEHDGCVHKMFYYGPCEGLDKRGWNPYQEIIISSVVTVFAEMEGVPHFLRLKGVSSCTLEVSGQQRIFAHMERLDRTLKQIASSLTEDQVSSLLFQYLRGCEFLVNHGIVHFDINERNLGVVNVSDSFIDYGDGWRVPTHGYIGKIFDLGQADRYIFPSYRTAEDNFNTANDCVAVIRTFDALFKENGKVVGKAIQFCEREFLVPFEEMTLKGFKCGVAVVKSRDAEFVRRLMDEIFHEYRCSKV